MTDSIILADHAGVRLTHGKPKVNGVEIHYAIGGAGEPVFLLHGVPKTMSYWRHVVPLLTPHYTVVAVEQPGGTRAILEMYRARQLDVEQNRPHYADPITCPVLAVGAQAYLGDEVSRQLTQVARDVRGAVIPESGHNVALENPGALAQAYVDFFAGR